MATKNSGYFPAAGAQNAARYPRTGPNYLKYGEQPGWTYSPRDDKYYRDQASRDSLTKYEEDQGLRSKPPSKPGLGETVLPIAATLGTIELAREGGKQLPGLIKGAFGAGSTPATTATTTTEATVPGGLLTAADIAAPAVEGIGPIADGAAYAANLQPNIGVMPYVGVAGAALGAKGVYDAIEANDTKAGAISGAGLGLGLGAAAPLIGMGPLGWTALGAMALGGAAFGGGLTSLLGHESTRDRQQKVTGHLMNQAAGDPVAQAYVQSVRQQFESGAPDPSKPYAGGKYATFEEYKKAGLDPTDISHVEGNIDTYTPQVWAKLTQPQREAVTKANIDAGLYYSKDGGVKISDPAKAKENFDNVMKGVQAGLLTAANTTAPKPPAVAAPPPVPPAPDTRGAGVAQVDPNSPVVATTQQPARSSTSSPGIGLDGRPIYQNRGLLTAR